MRRLIVVAGLLSPLIIWFLYALTSTSTGSEPLIPPEELAVMCNEDGTDCVALYVNPDDGAYYALSDDELYGVAQSYHRAWEEHPDVYDPVAISGLYLVVAQTMPGAYASYDEIIRGAVMTSDNDALVYTDAFTNTWYAWSVTGSWRLLSTMEYLYNEGVSWVEKSDFESYVRGEALSDWSLGHAQERCCREGLLDRINALALMGEVLRSRDRGLWQVHAADAAMECYTCAGTDSYSYDPSFAWAMYEKAGLNTDADKAAIEHGQLLMGASLMGEMDDRVHACAQDTITQLRTVSNAHDLLDESIFWLQMGGVDELQLGAILNGASSQALVNGRPDVSAIIDDHLVQSGYPGDYYNGYGESPRSNHYTPL